MALDSKKSNLTKGLKNAPVFRPSGTLSKKLSFYTPNFSTTTGVSSGAPQNTTTEAALAAPSNPSTGGSSTETVAPSKFQLIIGVRVQAATSESINLFYSTNSGSSWIPFVSSLELQYVPVGGLAQSSGFPIRAHYINSGDNLWVAATNASGSGTGSIRYGSTPGVPVANQNYTSSCGQSNPAKFDNVSGSSATFNPWIAIAITSGSLVPC